MQTLLDLHRQMPPYAVRLLARKNNRALTCHEIAEHAGMGADTVKRISNSPNWMQIKTEPKLRFMAACGVDLLHLKRHMEMIHRTNGLRDALHLRHVLKRCGRGGKSGSPPHVWKFYEALLAKMPEFIS